MFMSKLKLLDRIARTTYVNAVCCYRPSSVVCNFEGGGKGRHIVKYKDTLWLSMQQGTMS